jgi:hypothetical protein
MLYSNVRAVVDLRGSGLLLGLLVIFIHRKYKENLGSQKDLNTDIGS